MKVVTIISALLLLGLTTACNTKKKELKSAAQSLNLDLDLAKSPYRYAIEEKEMKLLLVLRRMPVGETAADATLRADIEREMARRLNSPPRVVEIRIFETQPNYRREIWLVDKDTQRLGFDIKITKNR